MLDLCFDHVDTLRGKGDITAFQHLDITGDDLQWSTQVVRDIRSEAFSFLVCFE